MDRRDFLAGALSLAAASAFLADRTALAQAVADPKAVPAATAADPLPSWNAGPTKTKIMDFVKQVTTEGGPGFVPPDQRVATFDNDGTLWVEQPFYTQLAFAIDEVKANASKHPEWATTQPFKAAIEGDIKTLAASGEKGLLELVMATHANMTPEEFEAKVKAWLATARHPRFKRPYDQLVYQPMLELLAYLRANGFKTFIVSGGGVEFMRTFADRVYGVPPDQVIGSTIKTKFEVVDGKPQIMRLAAVDFIDDKDGKPVGINRYIGQRPIAAFGNSDGDFQMLQWTQAGDGPRFALIVHHDDAEREYAYDRKSAIGHLERGLDEADKMGFIISSMKDDWAAVFPPEAK